MINHSGTRCFTRGRFILFPIMAIAALFLFGAVVMLLWNGVLSCALGLATLTYWQAIGLLILSKILFSSWHNCHGNRFHGMHHRDHGQMTKWWMELSEEERTSLWQEWEKRRQAKE